MWLSPNPYTGPHEVVGYLTVKIPDFGTINGPNDEKIIDLDSYELISRQKLLDKLCEEAVKRNANGISNITYSENHISGLLIIIK